MTVLPATLNLKFQPGQNLQFGGKIHQSDARGVVRDVPYDTAQIHIKNGSAVEATEADLAAPVLVGVDPGAAEGDQHVEAVVEIPAEGVPSEPAMEVVAEPAADPVPEVPAEAALPAEAADPA